MSEQEKLEEEFKNRFGFMSYKVDGENCSCDTREYMEEIKQFISTLLAKKDEEIAKRDERNDDLIKKNTDLIMYNVKLKKSFEELEKIKSYYENTLTMPDECWTFIPEVSQYVKSIDPKRVIDLIIENQELKQKLEEERKMVCNRINKEIEKTREYNNCDKRPIGFDTCINNIKQIISEIRGNEG